MTADKPEWQPPRFVRRHIHQAAAVYGTRRNRRARARINVAISRLFGTRFAVPWATWR